MAFEFEHVAAAPVSPLATEHMVRMRDGVRLAADVYLPEGLDGATEAVLVRLPYDKCGDYCFMPRLAPLFTAQGYVFVVQDVRGKFRSEGEDIPFVNEVLDGYDTLDWIVGQTWSNGRVGMFGDSYYGYTQWACVASGHPALRAICPRCTGADVVDLPRPGSDEVPLMLMAAYLAEHWVGSDAYEFEIDWSPRPLLDVFEPIWDALGGRSHGFDLSYPHPVPLRRFPTGHPFEARPVPTLQIMGWFDNIAPWQWDDHGRIAQRPDWSRVEYLHIDAVDHEIYHHADTPATTAIAPGTRRRRSPSRGRGGRILGFHSLPPMRPSRPMPVVGMPVRIQHFGSSEPGVIEAVLEEGRVIVVDGRRYRLHPSTAKFVAEGEPYYGTRVQLAP